MSAPMQSSRISRYQQKKLITQSLIFASLSIIIFLVFVFILLPITLRVFFPKQSGNIKNQSEVLPPQIPVLTALPEATNSAQLSVSGYGESGTTMTLVINDSHVQDVTTDAQGKFEFLHTQLQEGENAIYVISQNSAKSESRSMTQTVVLDVTKPDLKIAEPQDGTTVTRRRDQNVTVKGQTEKSARVYLNGKVLFVDNEGNFTGIFPLIEGDNTLTIQAIDTAGNITEQQMKVSFRP